jgi:hypothetical protein
MNKTTNIEVLDAVGAVIARQEVPAYAAGKRYSVWAANAQRKLDALIATNSTAVAGKIGSTDFAVVNGRSSWRG